MIIIPKLTFGNQRTLEAFLKDLNLDFCTASIEELKICKFNSVLIPGNGNWKSYVDSGLSNLIKENNYLNYIGICGGLQIFFQESSESSGKGASIFDDKVIKLSSIVPTIDYIQVSQYGKMYFANSYGVPFKKYKGAKIESYKYDKKDYIGALFYKNLVGFQFHPEVSGPQGRKIFLEFINELKFL